MYVVCSVLVQQKCPHLVYCQVLTECVYICVSVQVFIIMCSLDAHTFGAIYSPSHVHEFHSAN